MHEQHGRAVTLVDVGQAQTIDLAVVGRERKVGQAGERVLGCAHRAIHRARATA